MNNHNIHKPILTTKEKYQIIDTDWGRLIWQASSEIGNSQYLTIGECRIKPGKENPLHQHPNCEEILLVRKGMISHSLGNDNPVTMKEGDVITIPATIMHNARNIGRTEAILSIAFSSANRKTVNN